MLSRASYSARLTWFESLDWARVSRVLLGFLPTPPEDMAAGEAVPGFEMFACPGAFDLQYCHLPAQPDDKPSAWGVRSFAQSPAFGGKVRKEIAQRRGRRVPEMSPFEKRCELRFVAGGVRPGRGTCRSQCRRREAARRSGRLGGAGA